MSPAKRAYGKKIAKPQYAVTKYVKQPVPDGEYSEKITSHHQFVVAANTCQFFINWLNTGPSNNDQASHTTIGAIAP